MVHSVYLLIVIFFLESQIVFYWIVIKLTDANIINEVYFSLTLNKNSLIQYAEIWYWKMVYWQIDVSFKCLIYEINIEFVRDY